MASVHFFPLRVISKISPVVDHNYYSIPDPLRFPVVLRIVAPWIEAGEMVTFL